MQLRMMTELRPSVKLPAFVHLREIHSLLDEDWLIGSSFNGEDATLIQSLSVFDSLGAYRFCNSCRDFSPEDRCSTFAEEMMEVCDNW